MKKMIVAIVCAVNLSLALTTLPSYADNRRGGGPSHHQQKQFQHNQNGGWKNQGGDRNRFHGNHNERRGPDRQAYNRGPGPGHNYNRNNYNRNNYNRGPVRHPHYNHFVYNGHDFRRGRPVPVIYRNHYYRVSDWHGRGLYAPPRGHYWSHIDGRYVLIAATTGIITAILLNNSYGY